LCWHHCPSRSPPLIISHLTLRSQDIEKLHFYHHLAATNAEAISLALDAGVDMSMVPLDLSFYTTLQAMVKNGTVPESRLDESVMRILSAKAELGLF